MTPPSSCQVHQEQPKHVCKGCLTHRQQDIRSDGSRIEGSHKGWNLIQHAQPSGIVMLNALLNNFVLRRNLRLAQQKHSPTPFIVSSCGSHHLALVNSIALTHNKLKQSGPNIQLEVDILLILPDVPSGEVFGLTKSDYLTTFTGLIEVKEEVPNADIVPDDLQSTCTNSLDFAKCYLMSGRSTRRCWNSHSSQAPLRHSALLASQWPSEPPSLTWSAMCSPLSPSESNNLLAHPPALPNSINPPQLSVVIVTKRCHSRWTSSRLHQT